MTQRSQSDFSESIAVEVRLDTEIARTVERSLRVEAADLADERSATRIERDGDVVRIDIGAGDLTGLRAATNTWLGLVATAEDTAGVVRDRD